MEEKVTQLIKKILEENPIEEAPKLIYEQVVNELLAEMLQEVADWLFPQDGPLISEARIMQIGTRFGLNCEHIADNETKE